MVNVTIYGIHGSYGYIQLVYFFNGHCPQKKKKRLSCSDPKQIRQGWSVLVKPAVKPVAAVTLMLGSPNSNKTLPKEGVQKNWANQMANQMTNLMVI